MSPRSHLFQQIRIVFLLALAGLPTILTPPHAASQESDRLIANRIFSRAFERKLIERPLGETAAAIGRQFLGSPYEARTLETGPEEHLIINLRSFDCVTYIETIAALAFAVKSNRLSFDFFRRYLQILRYRDGTILGYESRLHYFTEWIHDNIRKGLLEDCTGMLGGTAAATTIRFMTDHRSLYPPLANDTVFHFFTALEESLSARPLTVIAKNRITAALPGIKTGDIIAITTDIAGLDVIHTGFALWEPDGSLHLLHASETHGVVEVTREPLERYLRSHEQQTGILILRLIPPTK